MISIVWNILSSISAWVNPSVMMIGLYCCLAPESTLNNSVIPLIKHYWSLGFHGCILYYNQITTWYLRVFNTSHEIFSGSSRHRMVTYYLDGKEYIRVCTPAHGPVNYLSITDEHGRDVSELILKYMGPEKHLGNISPATPADLGFTQLKFTNCCGQCTIYNQHDVF